MKIKLKTTQLSRALQSMQGLISDRALSNIGMRFKPGEDITLTTTDKVMAIFATISVPVDFEKDIFVPSKFFADVVRQIETEELTLEIVGESHLQVKAAGERHQFEIQVPLFKDMQWIEPPSTETIQWTKLDTSILAKMIQGIKHCLNEDPQRPFASVLYLHVVEERLRAVCSDGFRLSLSEYSGEMDSQMFASSGICLSQRTVEEILRFMADREEMVDFGLTSQDQGTLCIRFSDMVFYSRLAQAKYPQYHGVLPSGFTHSFTMPRKQILNTIKRVMLASDKNFIISLSVRPESVEMSAQTQSNRSAKEQLWCEEVEGEPVDITLNGRFILDFLNTMQDEKIKIQYGTGRDAILVDEERKRDSLHFQHVVMPIMGGKNNS